MSVRFIPSCIKTAAALVLAALLCLSFCACNNEIENVEGKNPYGGYSFSYPETWELLSDGATTVITVADVGGSVPYAVIRFTVADGAGKTATEYWEDGKTALTESYHSAEVQKSQAFDFEGGTAHDALLEVTAVGFTNLDGQPDKADGKAVYKLRQLVFEKAGKLCVATYMASKSNDEEHGSAVDTVKASFKFTNAEKAEVSDGGRADFYVPTPEGWTLETAEAYYTLSHGKATVTATVFSAENNDTALDCWKNVYVPDLKANFKDFTVINLNEKAELAGVLAVDAEYTFASKSGAVYHLRQTIALYNGNVYTVVLTASEEDYQDALAGYDAVINGFKYDA